MQEIADIGKEPSIAISRRKEELFLATVDHGMRNLKIAVDTAADSAKEPLERIAKGVNAYLTFFAEHPEIVELLVIERAHFRNRKTPTYFVHCNANMGPWQDLFRELIRGLGPFATCHHRADHGSHLRLALRHDVHELFRRQQKVAGPPVRRSTENILFHGLLTNTQRGSHA